MLNILTELSLKKIASMEDHYTVIFSRKVQKRNVNAHFFS